MFQFVTPVSKKKVLSLIQNVKAHVASGISRIWPGGGVRGWVGFIQKKKQVKTNPVSYTHLDVYKRQAYFVVALLLYIPIFRI